MLRDAVAACVREHLVRADVAGRDLVRALGCHMRRLARFGEDRDEAGLTGSGIGERLAAWFERNFLGSRSRRGGDEKQRYEKAHSS